MRLVPCLLAALLTGCVTSGPVIELVDTACDWTGPILISKADQLTDGTAVQILEHNENWEANCALVGP